MIDNQRKITHKLKLNLQNVFWRFQCLKYYNLPIYKLKTRM